MTKLTRKEKENCSACYSTTSVPEEWDYTRCSLILQRPKWYCPYCHKDDTVECIAGFIGCKNCIPKICPVVSKLSKVDECPIYDSHGKQDIGRCGVMYLQAPCARCGNHIYDIVRDRRDNMVKCDAGFNVCKACYKVYCPHERCNNLILCDDEANLDTILLSPKTTEMLEEYDALVEEEKEEVVDPYDIRVPNQWIWCPHCGESDSGYTETGTCCYWSSYDTGGDCVESETENHEANSIVCSACDGSLDLAWNEDFKEFALEMCTIALQTSFWKGNLNAEAVDKIISEFLTEEDYEWVRAELAKRNLILVVK